MYKLRKCFLLFLISVVTISCDDDFLIRNPPDKLSNATFWRTEDDLDKAITGCYHMLLTGGDGFGAHRIKWADVSDNAYDRGISSYNSFGLVAKGNINPTTGGIISAAYSNYYHAIAVTNTFIDKAPSVDLSADKMNQYLAQARFLRAYFYFRLTELYGGVPIILKSLNYDNIENTNIEQSSKKQVVKVILNDLNFAIENLPHEPYESHAVKGSALGLKTRVLLYNKRWKEAASTAKKIINSSTFKLADSYRGLFLKPTQNNNSEIMFSARYQLPDLYNSLDQHLGSVSWQHVQPIQNLIDAYECIDGKPIDKSPLYDPNHPYENRDPRLHMTNFVKGNPWYYGDNGTFQPSEVGFNETGYLAKKYVDTTRVPYSRSTKSNQDGVILRYADVLLMYAEAQNEVSGPNQSVYGAINKIRKRPGVNMPPLPKDLSQDEMRQRIRHERRVELALEGERYFDLKRWGIADKVIPKIVDPGGEHRSFEEKNYLWPFPQNAINKNPKLKQNPGY